jgi:16S rRNA processing protein RimM
MWSTPSEKPVAPPMSEDHPSQPGIPPIPNHTAGSRPSSEPVFLAVGRLRRTHGVHGEMQMDVLTDFPERLKPGATLYAGPQHTPLRVLSVRPHDQAMLIAFEGVRTPEEAAGLRNQILYVPARDLPPLEEDEYYHHQVLGLRVVDESGLPLGKLVEILETGANDVYIIRPDIGPELLLPAIQETILKVDLQAGEMRVHLLPGLKPE